MDATAEVIERAVWTPPRPASRRPARPNDVDPWAAAAVLLAWGLVPVVVGLLGLQQRDVV